MNDTARALTILATSLWLAVGAGCTGHDRDLDTTRDADFGTVSPSRADGSVVYQEGPGNAARAAAFETISDRCSDEWGTADWELAGERHFQRPGPEGTIGEQIFVELTYRCGGGEGGAR